MKPKTSQTSWLRRWLPVLVVLGIAILLRLYRIADTIIFQDDQGLDMLVIRQMELAGHRPLVGPYLTVNQVFTPPTYYYITWFFFHLTHSVLGIVYGYFIMNMISMLLLMKLSMDMAGRRAALITGSMFAVSSIMIEHSRTFWQPYPMQFFLVLCLLSLWHAFKRKNLPLLWLATLSYQLALSVYPSPIMLTPFVVYQLFRWYRTVGSFPRIKSYVYSAVTFSLTFGVVFIPQIIFEITNDFPTIRTYMASPAISQSLDFIIMRIGENIYTVTNSFTSIGWILPSGSPYILFVLALICVYLLGKQRTPALIRSFIAPWALLAGIGILYLHTTDVLEHRVWSYLPFLFLIVGFIIDNALDGSKIEKILATCMLIIYIFCNLGYATRFFSEKTTNNMRQVRRVAEFIRSDMASRGITQADTRFFHTFPEDDAFVGTDVMFRVFYWLVESGTITMYLTARGNNMTFDYSTPVLKPNVYIICVRFKTHDNAINGCVKKVMTLTPFTMVSEASVGSMYVFGLREQAHIAGLPSGSK